MNRAGIVALAFALFTASPSIGDTLVLPKAEATATPTKPESGKLQQASLVSSQFRAYANPRK